MASKAWLVSELTSGGAFETHQRLVNANLNVNTLLFADAVNTALRGVKFCFMSASTAAVYREGDTHALGYIGYRVISSRGSGGPQFFVESRRIANAKYRESSWQYNVAASKQMTKAVTHASTYLVPYTPQEAFHATRSVAYGLFNESVSALHQEVRAAYKNFVGDVSYGMKAESELMQELRGHTFRSPMLNEYAALFYKAYDAWKQGDNLVKKGCYYVGVTDNYGQQFVDLAWTDLNYPNNSTCFDRLPATEVADWVQGRLALLSMTQPRQYVPGVGVRLDDRVFYITKGDDE